MKNKIKIWIQISSGKGPEECERDLRMIYLNKKPDSLTIRELEDSIPEIKEAKIELTEISADEFNCNH